LSSITIGNITMLSTILIIEDEEILAGNIKTYLSKYGFDVHVCHDGTSGMKMYKKIEPDLILLDLKLNGIDGIEVLKKIRKQDEITKIALMTAFGNIEVAVDAMKAGANEFITKPIVLKEIKLMAEKLIQQQKSEALDTFQYQQNSEFFSFASIIGESLPIKALKQQIATLLQAESKASDGHAPAVLITGETGTGKELIAKAIHYQSIRKDKPFIEINCATLPHQLIESELFGYEKGAFTDAKQKKLGLIESADDGSLFLDEIGDMALSVQLKLLKVLEDGEVRRLGSTRSKKVNVRIIGATNQPLEKMIQEGKFRADLYFRLRIIHLVSPPLRERKSDIILLAHYFLQELSKRYRRVDISISEESIKLLTEYHWPGNIRELKNVIEQAILLTADEVISPKHFTFSNLNLTGSVSSASSASESIRKISLNSLKLEDIEKNTVISALNETAWNVSLAAKLLGVSRDVLRYRIRRYDLQRPK